MSQLLPAAIGAGIGKTSRSRTDWTALDTLQWSWFPGEAPLNYQELMAISCAHPAGRDGMSINRKRYYELLEMKVSAMLETSGKSPDWLAVEMRYRGLDSGIAWSTETTRNLPETLICRTPALKRKLNSFLPIRIGMNRAALPESFRTTTIEGWLQLMS